MEDWMIIWTSAQGLLQEPLRSVGVRSADTNLLKISSWIIIYCSGDFGGPLIQGVAPNEVLVGIASWTVTPCRTVGSPSGIYSQISFYTDWITQVTGVTP